MERKERLLRLEPKHLGMILKGEATLEHLPSDLKVLDVTTFKGITFVRVESEEFGAVPVSEHTPVVNPPMKLSG